MTGQLNGRTAIVTGAASGIGRATAALFAARGAAVLAVDRNAEGLADLAAEVEKVATLPIDLTDPGAAERVFAHCADTVGEPDLLANIAGLAGDAAAVATTDADLDLFLRVNLGITFTLSRCAVRAFAGRGGAIVNTSSTFALTGVRGSAPYSAAKGAVASLTRQLAADHGPDGIRVNAVAPGLIETPATAAKIAEGRFDELVTHSRPLPRVGRPGDVARVVAFLASDDAAFVTGVVVPVDGGWSSTHARY